LVEKEGTQLNVDILKLGHHGSDTSTSEVFVRATTPAYAIVSAGKDNSYGHPKPSVIERVTKVGACVLRTDEVGTIIFHSDGFRLSVNQGCSK
jgi:competence protein ComEC